MAYFLITSDNGHDIYVKVYRTEHDRQNENDTWEREGFEIPEQMDKMFAYLNSFAIDDIKFEWVY